jgi:predicted transport protein
MVRINLKTGEIIKKQEFIGGNPERQLQEFVEKYLNHFFGCHHLKSFYKIPSGEIDTLAITEEGVPCIIEFKHKKEDTIMNQIVFYYDWLQQRSTRFEFERIVNENENTKDLEVDWSKIRLICVAKEYSKWDISMIKHLDTDIECYTYTYHKDELDVHLDPIINQFKKPKQNDKLTTTKEASLESHREKADVQGKELLDELRKKVLELGDDVEEGYAPDYIRYYVNTTFLAIHVRKNWLVIHLKVNESNFQDTKKLTKDISSRKWSVTREMKISNKEELDYAMSLIKQAYDYQH